MNIKGVCKQKKKENKTNSSISQIRELKQTKNRSHVSMAGHCRPLELHVQMWVWLQEPVLFSQFIWSQDSKQWTLSLPLPTFCEIFGPSKKSFWPQSHLLDRVSDFPLRSGISWLRDGHVVGKRKSILIAFSENSGYSLRLHQSQTSCSF